MPRNAICRVRYLIEHLPRSGSRGAEGVGVWSSLSESPGATLTRHRHVVLAAMRPFEESKGLGAFNPEGGESAGKRIGADGGDPANQRLQVSRAASDLELPGGGGEPFQRAAYGARHVGARLWPLALGERPEVSRQRRPRRATLSGACFFTIVGDAVVGAPYTKGRRTASRNRARGMAGLGGRRVGSVLVVGRHRTRRGGGGALDCRGGLEPPPQAASPTTARATVVGARNARLHLTPQVEVRVEVSVLPGKRKLVRAREKRAERTPLGAGQPELRKLCFVPW